MINKPKNVFHSHFLLLHAQACINIVQHFNMYINLYDTVSSEVLYIKLLKV